MRTTIDIPQSLLDQAKKIALNTKRSLSDVVKDSLIATVNRYEQPSQERFTLPVFKGGTGMHPDIDPSSNASLQDFIDKLTIENEGVDKLR